MAGSRYTYVKGFELPDPLLPSTFFVIRIDGKGFHGFSKAHNFDKPNDWNALTLMNEAAKRVVGGRELNGECVMAFGESDEYSFVFKRSCKLHGRRSSKLVTLVVSVFTAAYVALWPHYFPNSPLKFEELPVFDGRVVQYTNEAEVRDYLRWRQVDTHINNMYNTVFWTLVLQGGRTPIEAEQELSGTVSSQKQEILFSQFGINYNNLEPMYRKGSLVIWEEEPPAENAPASTDEPSTASSSASPSPASAQTANSLSIDSTLAPVKMRQRKKPAKPKRRLVVVHEDLISDAWWESGRGKGLLEG
ncbi:tRNA(His) guanylyltransferase [Rhodotorula toruloides]|uniref:tRNA(His) guanylyltransferase n=1 Tax=Rhodotorula toruloides TaxID=5286 RepID=A0A0K3CEK6_RHOTO|nr:tRNA(His) guanylyltransferase [Rhodotorula toruloides]PRQ75165.1 Thg1 C terminal domain-domain containing protein [Rhodotorula toruloides]